MSDPIGLLKQLVTFPFSGRTAKNRFLKSAMSERLATFSTFDPAGRGRPTEELVRLYETWAKGDIGNSHPILYNA
jgi:2,4-dienoyl-CoA reductase-like NADH-dependent reductase (Old Yellow Enzyme family)